VFEAIFPFGGIALQRNEVTCADAERDGTIAVDGDAAPEGDGAVLVDAIREVWLRTHESLELRFRNRRQLRQRRPFRREHSLELEQPVLEGLNERNLA
jgi:hypothetical protein